MSEEFSQDHEAGNADATDVDVADIDGVEVLGADQDEEGPAEGSAPRSGHEGAPETGDLVIDASLRDLAETAVDDLDAQIERGEQVQRTLQGRLSDLGG